MGVVPRQSGERFVITSDREAGDAVHRRAPRHLPDVYQVWTGKNWSKATDEAKSFATMDEAEEYLRAHFAQIMA